MADEKDVTDVKSGRMLADDWIESYIRHTASQESPTVFHLWTAISCLAGALRRNVYLGRGYYRLYPNLYIILVAPSGRCRKSTAATMGVKILRNVDNIQILHEKVTPEGLIDQLNKNSMHATAAGSGKIEVKPDSHLFVFAPELSVFLGSQSYTSGLVELLTSLYEGKDEWDYTTKTHGKVHIRNVVINLFGASNPEWLAKGFGEDSFGGGFMGRSIFIYQDRNKHKNAFPALNEEQHALSLGLIADLQKIGRLRGAFSIAKEAYDFYEAWYTQYEGDYTGRMAGYYERKPEHIFKVAMVLSVARSDDLIITLEDIVRAKDLLEKAEALMPNAFVYIGATSEARVAQHAMDIIKSEAGIIDHATLLSKLRHLVKNSREFSEIMGTLEEASLIKVSYRPQENMRVYYLPEAFEETTRQLQAKLEEKKSIRDLVNEAAITDKVQ